MSSLDRVPGSLMEWAVPQPAAAAVDPRPIQPRELKRSRGALFSGRSVGRIHPLMRMHAEVLFLGMLGTLSACRTPTDWSMTRRLASETSWSRATPRGHSGVSPRTSWLPSRLG